MNHEMMQGMPTHMVWMWGMFFVVIVLLVVVISFLFKRAHPKSLLVGDLARSAPAGFGDRLGRADPHASVPQDLKTHDTIFILPDISHYTRFMTGNEFSFAHAQHIVFSLINAMIARATKTLELSKLEGDAALFFVDAGKCSPKELGETVTGIFQAFFTEQARLLESNLCPCRACRGIADLDLKIFVHRGEAARFEFKGSIDHFGTDVIILHRMMKNNVAGDRYVMVTDAAEGSISLPFNHKGYVMEEEIEHLGMVRAHVFTVDDATKSALVEKASVAKVSAAADMLNKIRANVVGIAAALKQTMSGRSGTADTR